MDRGMSRSAPYLPRYHSLSPAPSPQLGRRQFTSERSISQPSQRIVYIDNSPARVINSYHVHHSPSPHRTYKIHLCSSKTNHYLTRVTRSQSAYDINSSHVYTSHEDLFDKSFRETASRRVGSCEDIYHKAPFFPDVTPSESGVSFGESEEGSAFGGEDDNVSQHSFDSSSAFYEVTIDSELDKCDSDNFSGPDCIGDRVLGILHENDLDENTHNRKGGQQRSYRDAHSSDSSPFSQLELGKRDVVSSLSWDCDTPQARSEVLRVSIPDREIMKYSRHSNKVSDKRVITSAPLAQSSPRVSPGGLEELKLQATVSWNADDPFGEGVEVIKSITARTLFDAERGTGHSCKLEDSSCNSSCSDDNYSDISNITVSSNVPRKTKLVKKHSDKPASAKRNVFPCLHNHTDTPDTEHADSGYSTHDGQQRVNLTSGRVNCEDSRGSTSVHGDADNSQGQQLVANSEHVSERNTGNAWWTAYNLRGREVQVQPGVQDSGDELSSCHRDIRVVKPVTVNIPLISAGKHGREKLRRLSQTSPHQGRSLSRSPTLSPREEAQTEESPMYAKQIGDEGQATVSLCEGPLGPQPPRGLIESDRLEYYPYHETEVEERKQNVCPVNTACVHSPTSIVQEDNTQCVISVGGNSIIRETPQNEKCFESVSQPREHLLPHLEEGDEITQYVLSIRENPLVRETPLSEQCYESVSHSREHVHSNLEEAGSNFKEKDDVLGIVAQTEGLQFSCSGQIENRKCTSDCFPCRYFEISCETADTEEINSASEISRYVDIPFNDVTSSLQFTGSLGTEQVTVSTHVEVADCLIKDGITKPSQHDGAWAGYGELGSSSERRLQDTWETSDKFCSNTTAGLPALASQVFESSHGDGTSFLTGKSNQLDADSLAHKRGTSSDYELSESAAHLTVLKGNHSKYEGRQISSDYSSGTVHGCGNSSSDDREQFNVGLSSENTISLDDSETNQPTRVDIRNSKSIAVTENRHTLLVGSSSVPIVPADREVSSVEQHGQRLNSIVLHTSEADLNITVSNTGMEKFIKPGTSVNPSPSECCETSDMAVAVVATAHRIADSMNSNDSSLHRNAQMTQNVSSSLPPSSSNESSERTDTSFVFNQLAENDGHGIVSQPPVNGSDADKIRYSSRQQRDLGTDNCADIPRPMVDESIRRPSDLAQPSDKGINQEQHFCTEKSAGFVERGEEFISGKSFIITEISSRRIEYTQRTTVGMFVPSKQREIHSSLRLTSGNSCEGVDIVINKPVTETVTPEDDYCTITTTTRNISYSESGKEHRVSTDNDSLDFELTTSCLPVLPTSTHPEPVIGQGIHVSLQSPVTTHVPTCSTSVLTSRLTAQQAAPGLPAPNETADNRNLDSTSTGQPHHRVSQSSNTCDVLVPGDDTFLADMRYNSPLDSLQTQLSMISKDPSRSRVNASNDGDQYQDHAEATSVLKQIVRGDTHDFTHFSNTSYGSAESEHFEDYSSVREGNVLVTDGLNNLSVAGVDSDAVSCAVRECYDNDYDYVTTDLPNVTKVFSRPQHHHLLKPGQFKSNNLWTLQEEAESPIDNVSPKLSRKLPQVTLTPDEDNCSRRPGTSPLSQHKTLTNVETWNLRNENTLCNRIQISECEQKTLVSDSSDFDESDGNYSSISTADSDSRRSNSFGREQTPLSEDESVAMVLKDGRMTYQDMGYASQNSQMYCQSTFYDPQKQEFDCFSIDGGKKFPISVMDTEDSHSNSSCEQGEMAGSHVHTFTSSLTFCVNDPDDKQTMNCLSPLDVLTMSLEQFSTTELGSEGWKSFTEDAQPDSEDVDIDTISTTTIQSSINDAVIDTSSSLHTSGLDLTRASTCISPTPTDCSEGFAYTCTGSAEIKKTSSYHYDLPAYTAKPTLIPILRNTAVVKQDRLREEKVKQFEGILKEFNKGICSIDVFPEFIFLRDKRNDCSDVSTSSSEDLYKTFTKEVSEKNQNHVCIVVEDENMNTFRFKRYLKKSHTKRRKGKKVLQFLSKLGCVSEGVKSPIGSPNQRMKWTGEDTLCYSTDSIASPRPIISNPVLISSTSFYHHGLVNLSPLTHVNNSRTHFSSNHSLDSMPSRADSAYSSISESLTGALNSPASQRVSRTSFRVPPTSSGSVSSVFCSGSTSGDWSFSDSVFSSSSEAAMGTPTFCDKDHYAHRLPSHACGPDSDVMSALSDVFDQLNFCEDEIDSALLNRVRYGHTKAVVCKK